MQSANRSVANLVVNSALRAINSAIQKDKRVRRLITRLPHQHELGLTAES